MKQCFSHQDSTSGNRRRAPISLHSRERMSGNEVEIGGPTSVLLFPCRASPTFKRSLMPSAHVGEALKETKAVLLPLTDIPHEPWTCVRMVHGDVGEATEQERNLLGCKFLSSLRITSHPGQE
jgi:hypothetical protein